MQNAQQSTNLVFSAHAWVILVPILPLSKKQGLHRRHTLPIKRCAPQKLLVCNIFPQPAFCPTWCAGYKRGAAVKSVHAPTTGVAANNRGLNSTPSLVALPYRGACSEPKPNP